MHIIPLILLNVVKYAFEYVKYTHTKSMNFSGSPAAGNISLLPMLSYVHENCIILIAIIIASYCNVVRFVEWCLQYDKA